MRIGDLVRLKTSHNPVMTVCEIAIQSIGLSARCTWPNNHGVISAWFLQDHLETIVPAAEPEAPQTEPE